MINIFIYIISFIVGFIGGLFYFNHLYKSSKNAILSKRKSLRIFYRLIPFTILAFLIAYFFKTGIIFFLIGFYISRLTYTKFITEIK
ncbi:N-ATPase subunit AtpR [Persephonella sp.]